MIELRDYQAELVASTGGALRRSRRVLLVLPPGGGKTVIAAFIAQRFASRQSTTFFNCHRAELLVQTSRTFTKAGLQHGFIAAGQSFQKNQMVHVCSVDTLKRRLDKIAQPKAVIWDECHHIGAAGWKAIMESWPDAYHIGLTGTPWRLDGTGLGEFFDEMVLGPTPADLIEMGSLAPYEIYAPSAPDMKGVRKQMGDFARGDSERAMDKPKLTGDMITHWRKHAAGRRTVGYAVSVAHSKHMAEQFTAAGIPAAHLDGDTPTGERAELVRQFADGRVQVLFNVDLFGEGFDLSAIAQRDVTIDAAILARPTQSLSLYLQQSMRPMRPALGKIAIILDHAGNCQRHGFPDDVRDWTLDGREKGKKAANDNGPPPPVTCDGCFMQIRRPLPPCCPSCGKLLRQEAKPPEVAEGELARMTDQDKAATRRRLQIEQAEAKTLAELVALGQKRGYSSPQAWAYKVWSNRPRKAG